MSQVSGVTEPKPSVQETIVDKMQSAGLYLAGLWLVFLISVSVFIAVIIFSATQFQVRFANFVLYGGSLSIWKADQMREQWKASRISSQDAIESAKKSINETQQKLTKATTDRNQARANSSKSSQDLYRLRTELAEKLQRTDATLGSAVKAAFPDDIPAMVNAKINELRATNPTIDNDLAELISARRANTKDSADSYALDEQVKFLEAALVSNKADLKSAQDSSRLIIPTEEGKTVPDDQRALIENAVFEFEAMKTALYGLVYRATLFPSDMLALWLVIVMGLLGSSLQLVYVYVTQFEQKSITYYLIRPFFGIITAFVVFIVAKAGIPLVTDVTKVGGTASINPYFISFLAIISGLLSERALVSLLRLGSTYFRDTDGGDALRWARSDLTDEFSKASRDPAKVRELLKAKASEWDSWIKGQEAMPNSAQAMIAAVLGKSRRDLFTDIPPELDAEPS